MKRCEVCGNIKPEEEFSKSYKNRCKACVSMMTKHKRNLNKNAERMKAIYETPNPEIDAEIEKLLNPINWEERRFELAKSCMQAKLSINLVYDKEELAHHCIKMADEMIKQLKGESDLNETESLTPINQEGV